jgi:hypothetical protein
MFIFVLLNLICLSIILAKFIWHSENSRQETARYVNKLFGVPKTELELITEEQDGEELNHTCDQCNDGCDDDDKDEDDLSTHDSMPPLVETQTKGEGEGEGDESKSEESDDVSIEHVNVEDLEVIKDTLDYIQKTKNMLIEIKSDLEKKID